MENTCNPDGLFYITKECLLSCYYELQSYKEIKVDKNKCYNEIAKREVISANYSQSSFKKTQVFAWTMGSLNVLVLLAFLCWFNIPNYKRILDRSTKSDLPRWKQRVDYCWD